MSFCNLGFTNGEIEVQGSKVAYSKGHSKSGGREGTRKQSSCHCLPSSALWEVDHSTYQSEYIHCRGRLGFLDSGDGFTELQPGAAEKA